MMDVICEAVMQHAIMYFEFISYLIGQTSQKNDALSNAVSRILHHSHPYFIYEVIMKYIWAEYEVVMK